MAFIIVDGYNLLRAVQKKSEESESITDVQLCRIIGSYLKSTGEKGQMVFDGIGPPDKSGFNNIDNLEVFFAGRSSDADTVIEDKIRVSTAPKSMTVVSSDRRLRDAARARKATSVKADTFWNDINKRLSRKRTAKEPPAKRRGLTESETKQWLKIFGLEQ